MIEFMLQSQNLPFMVSLTIMIIITCLEGVATMIGLELSIITELFIPDFDVDTSSAGILTKIFGWFQIGQAPFIIILIAFLAIFGLGGLLLQYVFMKKTGHLLPGIIASGVTILAILPLLRVITGIIAKIMPKDETEAVAEKSFIGRVAVITLGKAFKNNPAQGKLKDKFGTTHYVMIEPDIEDEEFSQGDHVLIVKQTNAGYKGIQNSTAALQNID